MKINLFNIYALIVIICFSLQGCASYKQIKDMEVNESVTVDNIGAEELSVCVWQLMKEDWVPYTYHHNYDPIRKKWFVVSEQQNGWGATVGTYNFSVSFEDIANKKTLIEIRSLKTIWGTTKAPKESIFQRIKHCKDCLQH